MQALSGIKNHLRQEPVANNDDQQLVVLFQNGNERAFDVLVTRWQEPVFNFCYRFMGDYDDASECTQRVFIKVFKKLDTLKNTDAFKAWIYQIAMNQCRDELKKRKRFSIFTRFEKDDGFPESEMLIENSEMTDDHNPEWQFSQKQTSELIHKALLQIPEEQRLVVVMKELHQFTFPEITQVLGIPEGTVKSRLYYGLRALHKILSRNISLNTTTL